MLGLIINKYRDYKKFIKLGIPFSFWRNFRNNGENIRFNVQFLGQKISGFNPYWFFHSVDEIFINKVYLFQNFKESPRILDFGSNLGLSIIFFKKYYPNSVVLGFEPDPAVFSLLEQNLKQYNVLNCQIFNKAIWDSNCKLDFYENDLLGGYVSGKETMFEKDDFKKKITVEAIDASILFDQPVDFLKIDIEGSELIVLNKIKNHLYNVENMFIEYHSLSDEVQTLNQILLIVSNAGFRYYIKEAFPISSNPFLKVNNGFKYDLQLNIFCFRV